MATLRVRVKPDSAAVITGGTAVTDGLSLGGNAVFAQKNGSILEFRGISAGVGIQINSGATSLTIINTATGASGFVTVSQFTGYTASTEVTLDAYTASTQIILDATVTGGTSLGGEAIFDSKLGRNLQFKGLVAGTGISLIPSSTGITIINGATGVTGFVTTGEFTGYTASTQIVLDGKVDDTLFNTYTGDTATAIGLKVDTSLFNTYTGDTATAIGLKLDTSLFNTYTGDTATAIGLKLDTTIFNTYTGDSAPILASALTGVTNLGTGIGLFAQLNGRNSEFKSLVAGSGVSISASTTGITITNILTGHTGFVTTSTFTGYTATTETRLVGIELNVSNNTTGITANTAAIDTKADLDAPVVQLTGTTTLNATYAGKIIEFSGATGGTGVTITFPNSMNVGMQVIIVNTGLGDITLAASTTLQTKDSNTKLVSQYGAATAYHAGSNVWTAFGDLTA